MKRKHLNLARFFLTVSLAFSLTLALVPENHAFASAITIHIDGS